jgi:hypothetical protein
MITNYNAGIYKCYTNLKELLIELKIYFDENELKLFSRKFHSFLKDELFTTIFSNSKDEFLKKTGALIYTDDKSHINLTYLDNKDVKEDIKIDKYR